MVLNHEEVTAFALKNIEKDKNSKFYPRLERVERKLDAIINWINLNVKKRNGCRNRRFWQTLCLF